MILLPPKVFSAPGQAGVALAHGQAAFLKGLASWHCNADRGLYSVAVLELNFYLGRGFSHLL